MSMDPTTMQIDPLHESMHGLRGQLAADAQRRMGSPPQSGPSFAPYVQSPYEQLYTGPMASSYLNPVQQPQSMFPQMLMGLLGTLFAPRNPNIPTYQPPQGPSAPPPAQPGPSTQHTQPTTPVTLPDNGAGQQDTAINLGDSAIVNSGSTGFPPPVTTPSQQPMTITAGRPELSQEQSSSMTPEQILAHVDAGGAQPSTGQGTIHTAISSGAGASTYTPQGAAPSIEQFRRPDGSIDPAYTAAWRQWMYGSNPVPAPVPMPIPQHSQQTFVPPQSAPIVSGSRTMSSLNSEINPPGITRFQVR